MNPKSRITYRFDKQDGSRTEQKSAETDKSNKSNVVPFFQEEMKFTSEIGTWNSPFQNDTHALEQLIRETDSKPMNKPSRLNPTSPSTRTTPDSTYTVPSRQAPINREANRQNPPTREEEWNEHILLGDEMMIRDMPSHTQSYQGIDIDEVEASEADFKTKQSKQSSSKGLGSFKTAANYRPSRGPSWYKVFASVTAAIVTGALFGYFVLALFTNNTSDTTNHPAKSTLGDSLNQGEPAGTNNSSILTGTTSSKTNADHPAVVKTDTGIKTDEGSAATIEVQVPATSYYMLQYGVFSNKDGLNAAVTELNDKGLAAASLTTAEDFRVYVGMSTKKNEVQLLGQTLANMDVYVKQIDVPALSKFAFKGSKEAAESFFNQTVELVNQLDAMTLSGLNTNSTAAKSNWTDLHQKWTKSAAQVEAGIVNKADKAALLKLEQLINTAAVAASEYTKKPAASHLWTMQTALMEAIFTQKAWFASIDAL